MRIRYLSVRHFRGIQSADWAISDRLVCLIGPGDSAKSTLLSAIGLALSPRWSLALSDIDFYRGDISKPITIEATVTDLPRDLLREDRFGLWLRGVATDGSVHDEPADEHEAALTVRFTLDESLEPRWTVVSDALAGQEATISAKARASLGVFELDDAHSSHLRWMPGSALSDLTGGADVGPTLTHAQRTAREAVFSTPTEELKLGAKKAAELVRSAGGAAFHDPRPGLDPSAGGRGAALVLHDGHIPATRLGVGSRRLASTALQLHACEAQSIVLVDELELGLEPHRLQHLLRTLRRRVQERQGQVIFTTHSPLVVEAVDCKELFVVRRSDQGAVHVRQVPSQLAGFPLREPQATARGGPSALLGRRIVVCEGKTEVGLVRGLADVWDACSRTPMALTGTALYVGKGIEAPAKARCLAELGYETLVLADNDLVKQNDIAGWTAAIEAARTAGVEVATWEKGCAIEDQVAWALPPDALPELLGLAVQLADDPDTTETSLRDAVRGRLDGTTSALAGCDPRAWAQQAGVELDAIRSALGRAMHEKSSFKNETKGECLARLIVRHIDSIDANDALLHRLDQVRRFVYRAGDEAPAVSDTEEPQDDAH